MKFVSLAVGVLCVGLYAAQGSPASPHLTATATIQPVAGDDNPTQRFEGVIVSKNGQIFVLRDDVNNTWYHLDDQQAAAKHLGKKVSVTGTLDTRTDMIQVKSIDETT
jgi:hypothetical protein